jgi:hypothetical protein
MVIGEFFLVKYDRLDELPATFAVIRQILLAILSVADIADQREIESPAATRANEMFAVA